VYERALHLFQLETTGVRREGTLAGGMTHLTFQREIPAARVIARAQRTAVYTLAMRALLLAHLSLVRRTRGVVQHLSFLFSFCCG
jgi:hypothetical protein